MLSALLALLLGTFPSSSATAWMQPEAFHLRLGMSRDEAVRTLGAAGRTLRAGKQSGEEFLEYEQGRTVTLRFEGGTLSSIRFELVDFIPEVKKAFDEQRHSLGERFGEPERKTGGRTLIFERSHQTIFAVVSTDPNSSFGQKGLGFLVVRYFLPPPE